MQVTNSLYDTYNSHFYYWMMQVTIISMVEWWNDASHHKVSYRTIINNKTECWNLQDCKKKRVYVAINWFELSITQVDCLRFKPRCNGLQNKGHIPQPHLVGKPLKRQIKCTICLHLNFTSLDINNKDRLLKQDMCLWPSLFI